MVLKKIKAGHYRSENGTTIKRVRVVTGGWRWEVTTKDFSIRRYYKYKSAAVEVARVFDGPGV